MSDMMTNDQLRACLGEYFNDRGKVFMHTDERELLSRIAGMLSQAPETEED